MDEPLRDTAPLMERSALTLYRREVARTVRSVLASLRERGWPGKWPRELLITHKGRE